MADYIVGSICAVRGISVKANVKPFLNKLTYYVEGKIHRGIAINELVIIRRGLYDLVAKVEGEEIFEKKEYQPHQNDEKKYERIIDLKILGYFDNHKEFHHGIKYLPMLNDEVTLIEDSQIQNVYKFGSANSGSQINFGNTLLENLPITLPINGLFNSHIGIFGNTGSGKSNTLAKLYMSLLAEKGQTRAFLENSKFVFLDFGGEYENIAATNPAIASYLKLSTRVKSGIDKIQISKDSFWEIDFLSSLFSATEKTQKPFLNSVIANREKYISSSIDEYFHITLSAVFGVKQVPVNINLLIQLLTNFNLSLSHDEFLTCLRGISNYLNNKNENAQNVFRCSGGEGFLDSIEKLYKNFPQLKQAKIEFTDLFDELYIRCILRLINSISLGHFQYEHIHPLISKIEFGLKELKKTIEIIDAESGSKPIQIISLKECNTETKKSMSMLLVKYLFQKHKSEQSENSNKTLHFVIDEAHNILSEQSVRESESWKDYRLELFEEVIKEGRKFGFFLTLASQRPADISLTIISQLHNYFIHRLVNENDLYLMKNAISSLDSASRSLIPILPQGACVISGVIFHTPVLVQVDRLSQEKAPMSDTVDLDKIWSDDE